MARMQGRLEVARLKAQLGDIVLPRGPRVSEFHIEGEGIRLQGPPFQIELTKPAEIRAVVHQSAVEALLRDEAPAILKDIQVRCRPGTVVVNAKAKVVFEIGIEAECRLAIRAGGKELHVELVSLNAPGPVKSAVEGQLDRVNPVMTTADLPLQAELTQVELEDGRIILHGRAAP
jgi:hypothetical protein